MTIQWETFESLGGGGFAPMNTNYLLVELRRRPNHDNLPEVREARPEDDFCFRFGFLLPSRRLENAVSPILLLRESKKIKITQDILWVAVRHRNKATKVLTARLLLLLTADEHRGRSPRRTPFFFIWIPSSVQKKWRKSVSHPTDGRKSIEDGGRLDLFLRLRR